MSILVGKVRWTSPFSLGIMFQTNFPFPTTKPLLQ
jgi:hypothetical protein